MTKEEVRDRTEHQLSEFYDGFVLIGRIAGTDKFVFTHSIPDQSTKVALHRSLVAVIQEIQRPKQR